MWMPLVVGEKSSWIGEGIQGAFFFILFLKLGNEYMGVQDIIP